MNWSNLNGQHRVYACCGFQYIDLLALIEHFEDAHVVVYEHDFGKNALSAYNKHLNPILNQSVRSVDSSLAGALGLLTGSSDMGTGASAGAGAGAGAGVGHVNQILDHTMRSVDSSLAGALGLPMDSSDIGVGARVGAREGAHVGVHIGAGAGASASAGTGVQVQVCAGAVVDVDVGAVVCAGAAAARKTGAPESKTKHMTSSTAPGETDGVSDHAMTLLRLNLPFRCPRLNCIKTYKNMNGLKYHMTNG